MNDLERRVALHVADALKDSPGIDVRLTPLRRHRKLLRGERMENVFIYLMILCNVLIWGSVAKALFNS